MIGSLDHGLRQRKKDEGTPDRDDPRVNMTSDRGHDIRVTLSSCSPLALALAVLLVLWIIAFLRSDLHNMNQGSPVITQLRSRMQEETNSLILADGLLSLHIPGLDRKEGKIDVSGTLDPWVLQVCPDTHGTACQDSLDFPFHFQLHIKKQPETTILQAPTWQATDTSPPCGGGKAWVMKPPLHHIWNASTILIQLNWYQSACLAGHVVQPWEKTIPFEVQMSPEFTPKVSSTRSNGIFVATAAWQKNYLSSDEAPYVWSPTAESTDTSERRLTTSGGFVVEKAVVQDNPGYGRFSELGNYELLCFFGNKTMSDIRSSFLDIRPQIFNGQRPFKFHFYSMADFLQPDRYWNLDQKQRIRKCKHILVNLEEFSEPLPQKVYESQIVNLVGHVLRLMNDETFPIRIFTWTESPVGTRHCHSPYLPWTNDHPCNNVLHKLFIADSPAFPPRVKLLDNSDLTVPDLGESTSLMRPYLLAAIALRVFVLTGEQVTHWRSVGQMGKVDGLHRNGVVEPNFELVPYEEWGRPL